MEAWPGGKKLEILSIKKIISKQKPGDGGGNDNTPGGEGN